ncbi:transposase [Sorangium sp. So ce861]|uniref:transposase n=1 Tax=Sorangium sp. So ce861 TaxID=3133323 RepID=UPI003F5DA15A
MRSHHAGLEGRAEFTVAGDRRPGRPARVRQKERVEPQQDGLVRLSRRRAFADGTALVDMDPLSLLCRLAASVPPPRFHTVKYAGVLASASRPRWRASASDRALRSQKSLRRRTKTPLRNASVAAIGRSTNRAELLRRTFAIDVLECPACKGRMKLVAMVTEPRNIARFLSALGEPTDVPARSPSFDAAAAVLGVRGAGRRRRPGAPSVEEHRSAPQGAR